MSGEDEESLENMSIISDQMWVHPVHAGVISLFWCFLLPKPVTSHLYVFSSVTRCFCTADLGVRIDQTDVRNAFINMLKQAEVICSSVNVMRCFATRSGSELKPAWDSSAYSRPSANCWPSNSVSFFIPLESFWHRCYTSPHLNQLIPHFNLAPNQNTPKGTS